MVEALCKRSINLTSLRSQDAKTQIRQVEKTSQALQAELQNLSQQLLASNQANRLKEVSGNPRQRRQARMQAFRDEQRVRKEAQSLGSINPRGIYPDHHLRNPKPSSLVTLPDLLAAQTHLGHATSLWHPGNSSYIFGIRDGIHIISLELTLAHLRRACRVVQEVARAGGLILFVGTRPGFRDMVVQAAKRSKGYHIFDRWTPGSLTNGQQILGRGRLKVVDAMDQEVASYTKQLDEYPAARPDLVVCLNPLENEVCLHECGLYNVPTIGIVDTDTNPAWVTYPIPANDDSLRSVTLITMAMAMAGQEGQRIRLEAAAQGEMTYEPVKISDVPEEEGSKDGDAAKKNITEDDIDDGQYPTADYRKLHDLAAQGVSSDDLDELAKGLAAGKDWEDIIRPGLGDGHEEEEVEEEDIEDDDDEDGGDIEANLNDTEIAQAMEDAREILGESRPSEIDMASLEKQLDAVTGELGGVSKGLADVKEAEAIAAPSEAEAKSKTSQTPSQSAAPTRKRRAENGDETK
ncbi:MAG: hypothetical protein Q9227_008873 [Pyrenula ochraceoflavens]